MLGVHLLCTALAVLVGGTPSWFRLPIPDGLRYDDIWFIDPDEGWAVNEIGEIWHTDDGGMSWELQFSEEFLLFRSCGFANDQKGWAGTLDSERFLFETLDGGQTWTDISSTVPMPHPAGICGFTVVNEDVAYGVGTFGCCPILIRTMDGGATWTSHDLSAFMGGAIDLHFTSPTEGVISGCTPDHRAAIYSTSDGGETAELRHETLSPNTVCWKVHFPSESVGYGSIEIGPFFFKTTDGGQTWADVPYAGPPWQQGIGFATELIGWNGGRSLVIVEDPSNTYMTTDGGTTWQSDPFGQSLNRFQFFGSELGYAGGQYVYKYSAEVIDVEEVSSPQERFTRSYPNPFRPRTTIEFTLETGASARVIVTDTIGRHLRTIAEGSLPAGTHAFEWDGSDDRGRSMPSGVYLYIVFTGGRHEMGKLVRVE